MLLFVEVAHDINIAYQIDKHYLNKETNHYLIGFGIYYPKIDVLMLFYYNYFR